MINLKDKEDNNMYKCNDDYENIKRKIEEERKKYKFCYIKGPTGPKGDKGDMGPKGEGGLQVLLVLMLE